MTIDGINWGFVGYREGAIGILQRLASKSIHPRFIVTLAQQSAALLGQFTRLSQQLNCPLFISDNLNPCIALIKDCDFVLVCRYHLIEPAILALPRWGFINIHPSLLPQYRGVHPISWAIIDGMQQTGVTLHYINEAIDDGDIIAQHSIDILANENIHQLTARIHQLQIDVVEQLFISLNSSAQAPRATPQQGIGSYARRRTVEDSFFDWQHAAPIKIHNLVRALQPPYPLAYFIDHNNITRYVNTVEIQEKASSSELAKQRSLKQINNDLFLLETDKAILLLKTQSNISHASPTAVIATVK